MPLEVKKQKGENSRSLARRFSKNLRQSRILLWARKNRFRKRVKSEQGKKKAALRREVMKKEYEKLKKMDIGKEKKRTRT